MKEPSERITSIYGKPLPTFRSGVFYNTYPYPTKISPESIAVYIATHTDVGDTVLDAFSGSGATGLAALMCEHPTDAMLRMADELGAKPRWGVRNAFLYDISTYGCFAAGVMTAPPDADEFRNAARDLIAQVRGRLGNLYLAKNAAGNMGEIRHVVWSSLYRCPSCGREFTFYEGMVRWNPVRIGQTGTCPGCGEECSTSDCEPVEQSFHDALTDTDVTQRKRVPVLVYGETDGTKWRREATAEDAQMLSNLDAMPYPKTVPVRPIRWGDLHRNGYHTGITYLHHFYTKRNFLVINELWNQAGRFDDRMRDALRLLILSYNASNATLMTRVVAKKNSRNLVLTSAQSGVLYISNLPVEKNVLMGLERKIGPFYKAFDYVNHCSGHVTIHNSSSTAMSEPDGSVDYVFTDPPFGGFIPYSEVNQINELWMGRTTDPDDETIISPAQGKDVDGYGSLLEKSLKEAYRVLDDDGTMSLVFHSSKAEVWGALFDAIHGAGFRIVATSNLDRGQDSFKQVVAASSVKNDSLILLDKGMDMHAVSADAWSSDADNPREAYAQYVNHCLETGAPVRYDADQAYRMFRNKGEITQ